MQCWIIFQAKLPIVKCTYEKGKKNSILLAFMAGHALNKLNYGMN